MIESSTYLSFLLASTILIAVPGPTVMTIVSDAVSHGTRKSSATIWGAALAHCGYILITAFGMSELLAMSLDYFIVIKWLGVAYLVIVGLTRILSRKASMKEATNASGRRGKLLFKGFLVTISNPKAIVFYAAFFPPFLNPANDLLGQYVQLGCSFVAIFILLSFLSSLLASAILGNLAKRKQTLVNQISGLMMILAGMILATIKGER